MIAHRTRASETHPSPRAYYHAVKRSPSCARKIRAALLTVAVAPALLAVAAADASAQHIYRDDPRRPLAGCWRLDATHTLTLSGGHVELTRATFTGFAPAPFDAVVSYDRATHLLVIRPGRVSGVEAYTIAFGPSNAPVLQSWQYDHSRVQRAAPGATRGRHPLAPSQRWTLTRCP
jgi:hypothetical protein